MDSDWAGLPRDLLDLILGRFVWLSDYSRFGAVCTAWRSAALENINNLLPQQLPMLIVSNDEEDIWNLYSIKEKNLLPLQLPIPYNKRFAGSSKGWLVTVDENFAVHLLNPFYLVPGRKEISCNPNACITLPPVKPPTPMEFWAPYCDYHIHKAVLSANPISSPDDYMVMVIFGEYIDLAFIRPSRDKEWTYIHKKRRAFEDIIYYQDHFYAVDQSAKILSCDVSDEPSFKNLPVNHTQVMKWTNKYLVESVDGELLLVERIREWHAEGEYHYTIGAKVWKSNFSCKGSEWMEMKSLGDLALFLGDNSSFSVMASNFSGCHSNSIYFTEDYYGISIGPLGPRDVGVYNMETGSFTPHYSTDDPRLPKMSTRPPIWIVPSFKLK